MPLRIVLPSLIVSVAFLARIEPERSKIALAHAQYSRSATINMGPHHARDIGSQAPHSSLALALKRSVSLGMRLGYAAVDYKLLEVFAS